MRTKTFFSDPYDDLGDQDGYDPDMDMDEELYNEYGGDDTDIDLDEEDDYDEYDAHAYNEDNIDDEDEDIDDEDDGYRQTRKAIWSNMDWDKD